MFRCLFPTKVSSGIIVSEILDGSPLASVLSRFPQYVWCLQFSTSLSHTTTDQYESKHVSVKCVDILPFSLMMFINSTCMKSSFVQSALIVFNDWSSQQFSLYENMSTIEVEWSVGPIPIDDNIGKEVIIRYDTDIASATKYYTDANGREVLERIRDYRPTWNYSVLENVSGNYYPINSRIWIKDQQRQFTILTGSYTLCKNMRVDSDSIRSIKWWWKYSRWFIGSNDSPANTHK